MWGPEPDTMRGRKVNKTERFLPIRGFQSRGRDNYGTRWRMTQAIIGV